MIGLRFEKALHNFRFIGLFIAKRPHFERVFAAKRHGYRDDALQGEIFQRWNDLTILTIFDVTKEVTILKKIDFSRKEAEAKNILLEVLL